MNTTKFKSTVTKGNNRGAGFIRFPVQIRQNFLVDEQYKVKIDSKVEVYCKIRDYCGNGVFIPRNINIANDFLNKEVIVELEKIDGFYTKIGSGGRIYIPNSYNIHEREIIEIIAEIEGKEILAYPRIYLKERKHTRELIFYLNSDTAGKEAIIKIMKKLEKNKLTGDFPVEILDNLEFSELGNNKIILYFGNRVPVLVNSKIDLNEISNYLGCYFSDGTKKGNDWGICASTFEQATYYISKHNEIISDSHIVYSLTYTNYNEKNIEKLKSGLVNVWSEKIGSKIDERRVRIISTETEYAPNRNVYGALSMKEHRQLTQIYYNRLLEFLFQKILKENNKELATDFICGTMEGDGCVNSKSHGHILITTNDKEIEILKKICDKSYLKSSIRRWKGNKNRVDLLIGSLEIIENMPFLKDRLFKYYPKRRNILKERLSQTGCARFLLGKSKKTSNWLIGQLNERGILDGKGNLTQKGLEIKKNLSIFLYSS